MFPVVWTEAAIRAGNRTRLTDAIHIDYTAAEGWITSLDGGEVPAVGFLINRPVVCCVN